MFYIGTRRFGCEELEEIAGGTGGHGAAAVAVRSIGRKIDRVVENRGDRNERAVGLYERLGFRTIGTTRFTIGAGEVAEDLLMVLDKST